MGTQAPPFMDSYVGQSCIDVVVNGNEWYPAMTISQDSGADDGNNTLRCFDEPTTETTRAGVRTFGRGLFAEAPARVYTDVQFGTVLQLDENSFYGRQLHFESNVGVIGSIGAEPRPLITAPACRDLVYRARYTVNIRVLHNADSYPVLTFHVATPQGGIEQQSVMIGGGAASSFGFPLPGCVSTLSATFTKLGRVPAGQGHAWGCAVFIDPSTIHSPPPGTTTDPGTGDVTEIVPVYPRFIGGGMQASYMAIEDLV